MTENVSSTEIRKRITMNFGELEREELSQGHFQMVRDRAEIAPRSRRGGRGEGGCARAQVDGLLTPAVLAHIIRNQLYTPRTSRTSSPRA